MAMQKPRKAQEMTYPIGWKKHKIKETPDITMQDVGSDSPPAAPMPQPVLESGGSGRGRRNQTNPKSWYYNRKLLATHEFFIDPRYQGLFIERVEIIGTGVVPLPDTLNPTWLRNFYPKEMELADDSECHCPVQPRSVSINVDGSAVIGMPPK